ncbi:hypothetical protein KO489_08550 [Reinekea forsetii]|nr:hypothetical protein [Reinekea forsetii]
MNKLFFALILELSGAVIYLFTETEFFEVTATPTPVSEIHSLAAELSQRFPDESVSSIEARLRLYDGIESALEDSNAEIDKLSTELSVLAQEQINLEQELELRVNQIKLLNSEIKARQEAMAKLTKLEKQFLVKMAELNSRISEWGASINFRWQPEEKREVALMLQEAFKEIGFMEANELPNDDPMTAHAILERYQKKKRFKEVGFLTPQVVAFIVQDYLSPGLVR